ncbi:hypothetical protein FNV43_RR05335 [Rhamnella rubrinervis]|uniref:Transmembrane protein n=1 Tax=Rhamnella rubrinervis TaxID=2594499 RepID=A0A8K0HLE9_9ROSA|nr:hypothetical protein FNV43_RR05335 [Rhamnella rubrinervis]
MRAPKRTPPIIAPALAPGIEEQHQEEGLPFMKDKQYGLHGKIIMLILVVIFSVFIVFIVMFPYFKRAVTTTTNSTQSSPEWRKQRRRTASEVGAPLPPQVLLVSTQHQHEVNHEDDLTKKLPL